MTKEKLELVKKYAGLFLTIDDIAILLDLDPVVFRREVRGRNSELAKAYLKGKLESIVDIRELTVEFGKKGSPQAESFIKDYYERMEANE